MKNRMSFFLPRALGITVMAGVAAFALLMIFKVLLGLLIIGSVAFFARRMFGYGPKQFRRGFQQPVFIGANANPDVVSVENSRANVNFRTAPAIIPVN